MLKLEFRLSLKVNDTALLESWTIRESSWYQSILSTSDSIGLSSTMQTRLYSLPSFAVTLRGSWMTTVVAAIQLSMHGSKEAN